MSVTNQIVRGRTVASSGTPLFARIRNPNSGSLITQSSLSAITYNVRDLTAESTVGAGSLTPGDVVYDTLQTSSDWTQDSSTSLGEDGSTGYNFRWTAPASLFVYTPDLDEEGTPIEHVFQADVKFAPASGEAFVIPFRFGAAPVFI